MPGLFDKGPKEATKTTTQVNELPPYVKAAQEELIAKGKQMTSPFLATPAYGVAGLNTDQQAAFDGYRDMFINNQNWHGPSGQVGATLVDGAGIKEMMNPYTGEVIDTTLDKMRDERGKSSADIGARAAAAGSFGGSREAIQRAMLDKNFGSQVAQTAAQLRSQGFDKASQLAGANAQIANSTATGNAQRGMQANNDWYQKMSQSLQQLMAAGDKQQQFQQSAIDAPWTALQRLVGTTPGLNNTGGTSTATSSEPMQDNTLSNILGLGMMGAKLFMSSDEREKTDIHKLPEKDPETGLDMYSYRYRGDPKSYPKVVGPMAADVEKKFPDAVREIGGRKAVSAPLLKKIMGV